MSQKQVAIVARENGVSSVLLRNAIGRKPGLAQTDVQPATESESLLI